MRRLFAIAVCLSVVPLAAGPSKAKNQREKTTLQFESFWNGRLNEYRAEAKISAAQHKAASDAILGGAPFDFRHDDARLERLIKTSESDARISGKGQELAAFVSHMSSRPTFGLSQAYLQGRVQKAQQAEGTVAQAMDRVTALMNSKGATVGQLLVAVEAMAMARGDAIGRAEELALLIENYTAYSADFAEANQRDRDRRARWIAALGAAGRSMASQQTHTVTCTGMGNMVNCMGQ